jgi:tetratricopeptide (TPR) repeat protein
MRKINVLLRYLLCLSLLLVSCQSGNKKTPKPDYSKITGSDLHMLIDRGDLTAPEIARMLELKVNRSYEDLIDLGTAYLWQEKYLEAAEAYEMAAQDAKTKQQLMGALYNKTGSLAYAGYMKEALRTADALTKLEPNNLEVAYLRYGLYQYSQDGLGKLVSAEHLVSLDPNLQGEQVIAPIVVVLISVVVVYTAFAVTTIVLTAPENRKDAVIPLVLGYGCIASIAATPEIGPEVAVSVCPATAGTLGYLLTSKSLGK